MSIYLSVCLCDSHWTLRLNQLIDIVEIRYLGYSAKIQGFLFLIFPLPLKLTVVHISKEKKSGFLKNGINNFDQNL